MPLVFIQGSDVVLQPYPLPREGLFREGAGLGPIVLDGLTGMHGLGRVHPDQAHAPDVPRHIHQDGIAVDDVRDDPLQKVAGALFPVRGQNPQDEEPQKQQPPPERWVGRW